MSDGRESEKPDAGLTPGAQQAKDILEQGVRDLIDVEEFKGAGTAAPAATGATSPPAAAQGDPSSAAPPDLPTEADAAAYLHLINIAASADVDSEADEDPDTPTFTLPSFSRWSFVLGIFILAVFIALIAGRLLRNPAGSSDGAPVPLDPSGQTCIVDESAVVVQSVLSETTADEDSTKTSYVGTATFTNTTAFPIYLNLSRSQSLGVAGQTPVEGWWDYQILLPPGAMHTATHTGQSWTNRNKPTWTVYTDYAAYPATDECRLAMGDDATLDTLARPVINPLPVGPKPTG